MIGSTAALVPKCGRPPRLPSGPRIGFTAPRALTRREIDVAALVCEEGIAAKEISARLGLGYQTVKLYLARVYRKTGVDTCQALIVAYWKQKRACSISLGQEDPEPHTVLSLMTS